MRSNNLLTSLTDKASPIFASSQQLSALDRKHTHAFNTLVPRWVPECFKGENDRHTPRTDSVSNIQGLLYSIYEIIWFTVLLWNIKLFYLVGVCTIWNIRKSSWIICQVETTIRTLRHHNQTTGKHLYVQNPEQFFIFNRCLWEGSHVSFLEPIPVLKLTGKQRSFFNRFKRPAIKLQVFHPSESP